MTPLLHFPCRDQSFEWDAVNEELLTEQRDFERLRGNREKRVRCVGCGSSDARYVVCVQHHGQHDHIFVRRFPHSGSAHLPSCYSYSKELPRVSRSPVAPSQKKASGDFAALKREIGDPELRPVTIGAPSRNSSDGRSASATYSIGLKNFGREILQLSGMCDWSPSFLGRRSERVFNGRVKQAIEDSRAHESAVGAVLRSLPGVDFIPWSFLNAPQTDLSPRKCVGFGFVDGIGPVNEHGGRPIRLANYSELCLTAPRTLFWREEANPWSGLSTFLVCPAWVIFVAVKHAEQWKIHHWSIFRVAPDTLLPIESGAEELMVKRLVAEKRRFKRWLVPPPDISGKKWVPDFQLLDTPHREFIEVAGMLDDVAYAKRMTEKKAALGERLLVWDTRTKVESFNLPPSIAKAAV